jgi:hypothetical protein
LHADISSAVGGLFGTMLRGVSQNNESAVMINDGQRQALLRGVFENYYYDIASTKTVIDTNRGWTVRLHLLASLFPDSLMFAVSSCRRKNTLLPFVSFFGTAAPGKGRRHDYETTVDHSLIRGLVTAGPVMRRGASSV